jgi:RNA recognition motif-containing protein
MSLSSAAWVGLCTRVTLRVLLRASTADCLEEEASMSFRIYVGNLPYTADGQQLAQIFSQFGEVADATVVMDRDTGRSKGFGFVEMVDQVAGRAAIAQLDGSILGDRTVRVNEARPREERSGRDRGPRW